MSRASIPAPLLESGDRMDRAEFHRRYALQPGLERAELIEGVVYVPSPMRYSTHDDQASLCVHLLRHYAMRHPRVRAGANASIMLDDLNEVQADGFLFYEDGGRLRLRDDGYLEGAPEFVVEVAASTVSRDLHDKLRAYERNGVLEYAVWRVADEAIDWFELQDGRYVRRAPGPDGVIESRAFPGSRLAIPALLEGREADAVAVIG